MNNKTHFIEEKQQKTKNKIMQNWKGSLLTKNKQVTISNVLKTNEKYFATNPIKTAVIQISFDSVL